MHKCKLYKPFFITVDPIWRFGCANYKFQNKLIHKSENGNDHDVTNYDKPVKNGATIEPMHMAAVMKIHEWSPFRPVVRHTMGRKSSIGAEKLIAKTL